jgi:hypothetical protein
VSYIETNKGCMILISNAKLSYHYMYLHVLQHEILSDFIYLALNAHHCGTNDIVRQYS